MLQHEDPLAQVDYHGGEQRAGVSGKLSSRMVHMLQQEDPMAQVVTVITRKREFLGKLTSSMVHMLQHEDPLAQVVYHGSEQIEEVPGLADQQHGAHATARGSTGSGRLPWGVSR